MKEINNVELTDILGDKIEASYCDMVQHAYDKLMKIEYFRNKKMSFWIPQNPKIAVYQDETDMFVDVEARYSHKGKEYIAEINILLEKNDEMNGDVQIAYNCSNEIYLNIPADASKEVKRFLASKKGTYREPEGSVLINSKYLGKTFFAFSKDYVLYTRYSPTQQNECIKISEFEVSRSAKAHKDMPMYHSEYMPNKGAIQVWNEVQVFDADIQPVERMLCRDVLYPNNRELRQYHISPTKNGCIIKRSEYGIDLGRKRYAPWTHLTKHIGVPFDKLGNMNNLAMIFEKQCRLQDRSKLVSLEQEKDEYRQNMCIMQREARYVQKKKRLAPYNPMDTYEDYKMRKENSHDASIKYAASKENQNIDIRQTKEPDGVQYLW